MSGGRESRQIVNEGKREARLWLGSATSRLTPSWKHGAVPSRFTDEETEAYRLIRSDYMTPTGSQS